MNVCFDTFGCRLSRAEALQQEADYLAAGWTKTDRHDRADLIIVRGCSVTASAESDCRRLVAHLKRKYPFKKVLVTGCLDEKGTAGVVALPSQGAVPVRTARAYLKVQDGCSGKCTFCTVPKFRGKARSEDFTALIDKAKRFVEVGYHELVVTGCNLSLYASQGKRLPELISALAEVDAGCRVRLGSLEPGEVALPTVEAIAAHENCCRFLHLPVQSGSNRVLLAMGRNYKIDDVEKILGRAKELMPVIGLGCDLMTGFPGETDGEYLATHGFLDSNPFSNAHIFPYSERPGTPAAGYPSAVPKGVRSERARRLSDLAKKKRMEFAKTFRGKIVEAVIENTDHFSGWTSEYMRVGAIHPDSVFDRELKRKTMVKFKVVEVHGDRLGGKVYV